MRRPRKRVTTNELISIIESCGAKFVPDDKSWGTIYPYQINTKYGVFYLNPVGFSKESQFGMASVFGRFADPAHAFASGVHCNPYSGKYNWHDFCDLSPNEFIDSIRYDLNRWETTNVC